VIGCLTAKSAMHLARVQKNGPVCGGCGKRTDRIYDKRWPRGDREVYLDFEMRRVNRKTCGVKNGKLAFLSENTKHTLRFAMRIGGLCRAMTGRLQRSPQKRFLKCTLISCDTGVAQPRSGTEIAQCQRRSSTYRRANAVGQY
jgi:hypothetical protein